MLSGVKSGQISGEAGTTGAGGFSLGRAVCVFLAVLGLGSVSTAGSAPVSRRGPGAVVRPSHPAVVRRLASDAPVTCFVRQVSDGAMAARSHAVTLSDGREITIVGHDHGDRDAVGGAADLFRTAVQTSVTGVGLQARVEQILASDPSALADARLDVGFLRPYLRANPTSFVAVEASPETVKTNVVSYGEVRRAFLEKLHRFHRLSPSADDIQAVAFGSDFFLRLSEPALYAHVDLRGVEDPALGAAYAESMRPMDSLRQQMSQLQFDPQVAEKVSALFNGLPARYATYRPENDYDGILRSARASLTAGDYAKIDSALRLRLKVMNTMKARDRHDVAELLALKRSGVMFIGRDHLESITQLLRESCAAK